MIFWFHGIGLRKVFSTNAWIPSSRSILVHGRMSDNQFQCLPTGVDVSLTATLDLELGMDSDSNCIFCEILAGEADASIVYQDTEVTVFMDLFPVNPGHMLVIPNTHSAGLEGMDDEILGRMFIVGRMMAMALRIQGRNATTEPVIRT